MSSPTITIRMKDEEKNFISEYAEMHGLSLSDFIRSTLLEKIEDELDVKIAEEAYEEYLQDPQSYSAQEIEEKYL